MAGLAVGGGLAAIQKAITVDFLAAIVGAVSWPEFGQKLRPATRVTIAGGSADPA